MKTSISASPPFFVPASPTPLKQYLGVGEASRVGRRNELLWKNGLSSSFIQFILTFRIFATIFPLKTFNKRCNYLRGIKTSLSQIHTHAQHAWKRVKSEIFDNLLRKIVIFWSNFIFRRHRWFSSYFQTAKLDVVWQVIPSVLDSLAVVSASHVVFTKTTLSWGSTQRSIKLSWNLICWCCCSYEHLENHSYLFRSEIQ